MNAGFRNLLGRSDTSKIKAYLLAVALQMLIVPVLAMTGLIQITVPSFYPAAVVLGGFLFGLAMKWGGGCAAGLWYKLGSGNIGAFVGIFSLIVGYVATENGVLKPFRMMIQSTGGYNQTLASALNIHLWWISLPLSIVLLVFLLKNSKGELWKRTGLLVGSIAVVAWVASAICKRSYGMAIMPGSKDAFDLLTSNRSISWDLFFVLGIPVGSYLSAIRNKEFKWTSMNGSAIWKITGGGLLLGISASVAGGCTVGHGLTGVPLLSVASISFTIFAILGAWLGVVLEQKKKVAVPA